MHARNKSGDMMMLWWEVLQRFKMLNWELLWHMGHLRARTRITTDLSEEKVQVFTSRGLRLNSTSIQSYYFLVWCFFKLVSITVFLNWFGETETSIIGTRNCNISLWFLIYSVFMSAIMGDLFLNWEKWADNTNATTEMPLIHCVHRPE